MARDWQLLIDRGIDPRVEVERQRRASAQRARATVAAAFGEFETEKLVRERKGSDVAREFRRDILDAMDQSRSPAHFSH
jgi:hypothetical protein